ncbi:unnamed protein product [Schistosoma margrebowiei]|uniref:Uncharacterized protein n=1 Tax=Schistosoma margrebowiei TaxID=48269 RepID=A0A183LJ44_9TREM|nr:unnamed protein product [Schistosoma margrebowiei]
MGRKPLELRNPSSKRFKYLLTIAYAKYLGSVGQTISATTTTVRENKSDPTGGTNQEEEMEVDGKHIEESTKLRHKASPHMKSSRLKQERKTKECITLRTGDRQI